MAARRRSPVLDETVAVSDEAEVELSQGNPEVLEAPGLGAPPAPTSFVVAPGRAITTRARGIIPAGMTVYASDFSAGEARLTDLVSAGYIVAS